MSEEQHTLLSRCDRLQYRRADVLKVLRVLEAGRVPDGIAYLQDEDTPPVVGVLMARYELEHHNMRFSRFPADGAFRAAQMWLEPVAQAGKPVPLGPAF